MCTSTTHFHRIALPEHAIKMHCSAALISALCLLALERYIWVWVVIFFSSSSSSSPSLLLLIIFWFFITLRMAALKIQYCATFDRITFQSVRRPFTVALSPLTQTLCGSHSPYRYEIQHVSTIRYEFGKWNEWNFDSVNRKLFTHQKSKCNDSDPWSNGD